MYLEPAYRLFVHDEDDDWCSQGRYENIISRTPTSEDYVKWTKDEKNNEVIRVLGVSLYIYIYFNQLKKIRQLSIPAVRYIFQALLAVALVSALVQVQDHIQALAVQLSTCLILIIPTPTCSKVLPTPSHSMAET